MENADTVAGQGKESVLCMGVLFVKFTFALSHAFLVTMHLSFVQTKLFLWLQTETHSDLTISRLSIVYVCP